MLSRLKRTFRSGASFFPQISWPNASTRRRELQYCSATDRSSCDAIFLSHPFFPCWLGEVRDPAGRSTAAARLRHNGVTVTWQKYINFRFMWAVWCLSWGWEDVLNLSHLSRHSAWRTPSGSGLCCEVWSPADTPLWIWLTLPCTLKEGINKKKRLKYLPPADIQVEDATPASNCQTPSNLLSMGLLVSRVD